MNLSGMFFEGKNHSNHALISLNASLFISCPPGEVISDTERELYCLLYSIKGAAAYKASDKVSNLPAGSLLFLPCSRGVRLRASNAGWEAHLFFISGNVLPFYYEAVRLSSGNLLQLSPASPLSVVLNRLILLKQTESLAEEFVSNECLTEILAGFIHAGALSSLPSKPPSYLVKVKETFDRHYSRRFSLDELAAAYKVSKYRLCREFSRYYELSPIKYLNRIRIQNACLLLVSGEMHINEIAAEVGVENINHFIRLFKAQLDMTPMQYRQKILNGK